MQTIFVVVVLAITGCGTNDCQTPDTSGQPPAPSETPETPQAPPASPPATRSNPPPPPKPQYTFGLPKGDLSPNNEAVISSVFDQLARRRCKAAQTLMAAPDDFRTFRDPRDVLIFQAAVDLCGNDDKKANPAGARRLWDGIGKHYGNWNRMGWASNGGALSWYSCEMYKAVGSVMLQKPKDEVVCSYDKGDVALPVREWEELAPEQRPDPRTVVTR